MPECECVDVNKIVELVVLAPKCWIQFKNHILRLLVKNHEMKYEFKH